MELKGERNEIAEDFRKRRLNRDAQPGPEHRAKDSERHALGEVDGERLRHRSAEATQHGHGAELLFYVDVNRAGHTDAAEQQGDEPDEI